MKNSKVLTVKGFEYRIVGKQVIIIKNGEEIKLELEFGKSAYHVAYAYLNKKGSSKKDGICHVGNFEYGFNEADGMLNIRNSKHEVLMAAVIDAKAQKHLRNTVINWLLKNLK